MTVLHPILQLTPPSDEQLPAVLTLDRDVVLTAGAGTGKTRTLVARVLQLLAQGVPARNIFAVTFTVKAAREMRNRLRKEITAYLALPDLPASERGRWDRALVDLESARIGTIHSLCTEILRSHPAEANVDPAFGILDEAVALQLRADAIAEAVAWAADDPEAVALFTRFSPDRLAEIVVDLLADRLKVQRLCADQPWQRWDALVAAEVAQALADDTLAGAADTLLAWDAAGALARALASGDTLAPAAQEFIAAWRELTTCLAAGDLHGVLPCLARLRSAAGGSKGKAANWPSDPKPVMSAFRGAYDLRLKPLVAQADIALDHELANLLPLLQAVFERALAIYQARKQERFALDFDDLEQQALDLLLHNPHVLARWREETAAMLVDEFQDTNQRQRELVELLNGGRGRLFIVGDAKQSIYRFRGAEVEVFRSARREIGDHGFACSLARSHRTHRPLLAVLNRLLAAVMGEAEIIGEPWHEPFAALDSVRLASNLPLSGPHVELHLACGTKGDGALERAAQALAHRLQEMVAASAGTLGYGDIAVLCRGYRGFGAYEDAFEAAGIPYETVAGRGFLSRPEIRDLLNGLAAVSDPSDDLALYGLLRSPAFGLADTELHRIRLAGGTASGSLWRSLCADDAAPSRTAAALIGQLSSLAGRVSVADLLKRLVDATYYRAVLLQSGDARGARNVSKLLQDAQRSGIVGVGQFLEYVQGLRSAGSREGEARADSSGSVQIMTVHQAKGLEFPVVVIGDAGSTPGGGGSLMLDGILGVVPYIEPPTGDKRVPLVWKLAAVREAHKEAAENKRLLYVAATRARDRLLISGHIKIKPSGELSSGGWLQALCEAAGLFHAPAGFQMDGDCAAELAPGTTESGNADGGVIGVIYGGGYTPALQRHTPAAEEKLGQEGQVPLLLPPLAAKQADADTHGERVWRVAPHAETRWAPAWVIGKLVHAAIATWRWPGEGDFGAWCRATARGYGLVDDARLHDAERRTRRLLDQLRRHPLYAEIAHADERHHELPFTALGTGEPAGQIDLLFRRGYSWTLVDFKTDRVRDEHERASLLGARGYGAQVARYAAAVQHYLGVTPRCILCLLDDQGRIGTIPVEP
ncbi:MAG: UvrD-helicase domain-containing protein [Caldilineaceae bacterium]